MKKKPKQKKEKVKEIFEVAPKKYIEKEGEESVLEKKPGQEKHDNNVLKWILISAAIVLVLSFGFYFYFTNHAKLNQFPTYKGIIKFQKINSKGIIFYKTSIPYVLNGTTLPYNFYLRTSPKDLEKIPFDSKNFKPLSSMAISITDNFKCNGDGVIAIANLAQLNTAINSKLEVNQNLTCGPNTIYNYFNFVNSTKTQIIENSPNCYTVDVSNCEIIPAVEKIMAETFVKIKD